MRGIHRSPVNSPHKGQWRGALMFSLICVWINDWVNNREAGDLRRYRAHSDAIVMTDLCADNPQVDHPNKEPRNTETIAKAWRHHAIGLWNCVPYSEYGPPKQRLEYCTSGIVSYNNYFIFSSVLTLWSTWILLGKMRQKTYFVFFVGIWILCHILIMGPSLIDINSPLKITFCLVT